MGEIKAGDFQDSVKTQRNSTKSCHDLLLKESKKEGRAREVKIINHCPKLLEKLNMT